MGPRGKGTKRRFRGGEARVAGSEEVKAIVGEMPGAAGAVREKEAGGNKEVDKCYHKFRICIPVTGLEKSKSRIGVIC